MIVAVCLIATALNLILTAVLFRQLGLMVMGSARGADDSGISVGRRLPALDLIDARTGAAVDVHDQRRPQLVFFGSTTCHECAEIYPDIRYLEDHHDLRVVNFLFGSDLADIVAYAGERGIKGPVVVATEDLATTFDVEVSPFAFVVDQRGLIVSKGLLNSRGRLIDMLAPVQRVDFDKEAVRENVA
ncbi:TlpA family protein disulfide reductase [Nonomuraea sp. NPDC002799]